MKITGIFILLACLFSAAALADEDGPQPVPGHPNWTVELIRPESTEDGAASYRQPYYTLKPPDARPTASITYRAAEQLLNGELGPEAVYNGGNGATAEAKSEGDKASGVSGPSVLANNNTLTSGRSPAGSYAGSPARPVSGASAIPGADSAAPASATAAAATSTTTATSSATPAGESTAKSVSVGNDKPSTELQVGAVGKGTATATAVATVTGCNSIANCKQVAGANLYLDANSADYQAVNAAYVCSKAGKSSVASSAVESHQLIDRTIGSNFLQTSVCRVGSGCTDSYLNGGGMRGPAMGTTNLLSSVTCK